MLIAAFTGGYVTARLSGTYLPSDGMWHGVVVWGVNWLIFAWLTTTAMSAMIGGVFSVFGTTLQTLGQSVSGIASTAAGQIGGRMGQINISGDEIRRQIESVLAATGKPELQPGEVRSDAERVAGAARGGRPLNEVSESAWTELRQKLAALDRDAAINVMVNKFGMSETQARQVVQSTIGVLGPIQETVQEAVGTVREQSNQALDRLGTIALWLSVLALITLGLSAWGGMVGTPDESTVAARAASESFRADIRRAG
jgi:amino acid transporter